ncbi:FkbM family methyltransferase [Mucilaginibacter sp. UR6-11]|uniref:FkbM family methyltransferase n=1 Tax=Mucilaginibacter sp. UR6-11 TaxID=1435644 RepID=UPI001E6443BD|nr:FkbM family methyltransferase [Mucilaginibacter sp. UR6-11]MCC8425557.1 FkbM family methyltransferase [Mucilaginibacter sp. UR6-11]
MNFKSLIPNSVKQEGKYFLYYLLKIPFNRAGVPSEIVKFLPNDKPINIIDIGASEGKFTGIINNHYKINKAILVEPIADLKSTLENKFPDRSRFRVETIVISESTGDVDFYYSKDASVLSSILKVKNDFFDAGLAQPVKIKIKSETLDNVVEKSGLEIIDLLKIDVQGVEHLVLNSGLNALKKTRLVYTEFSYKPMYEGSSTFFDLFKILTENNFRLVSTTTGWINPDGEIIQGDALFVNNLFG